jgi:hypothetical protein
MRALVTSILVITFGLLQVKAQESKVSPRKWYVPDFAVAQYAGSIGFLSAGAGYDIFKGKGHIDLLVGYVPQFTGSKSLETLTLKFTAAPLKISVNQHVTVYPLTTGIYFCYTPGKEFSSDLPSWYPEGYYWWSEAIRANIFLGGKIKIASSRFKAGSFISPYYEVGTNEIKLVSYAQNASSLSFWKILHAGIGVRYNF